MTVSESLPVHESVHKSVQEDGPKRTVRGTLVKVLVHRRDDRGMRLEPFASRCVRAGEVHELVTTDHHETEAGSRVDRVGFLGFVEIANAGVIDRGDEVWAGDRLVGTVLGFDSCHFPNHYNVLIRADAPRTGPELRLEPEVPIRFQQRLRPAPASAPS
ncbi:hypothetical protein GCM10023085_31790 [Actinomadura viridis]|uniref:DUF6917 domain-containing protein n=1 Tax=Actinomadura viridis TaxID=58110 RepID=A0A931DG41_9ACTN|nr:hypothetical protein [Actinomadura viridis]MBG6086861.1 hypothetical protein [Actinomadura viridis]